MTMKVLFIGNYDGAQHRQQAEVALLAGLMQRGIGVEVMTAAGCACARQMAAAGIPVHDLPARGWPNAEAVRAIRRVLEAGRHDVVHYRDDTVIGSGNIAAWGLPVKVVARLLQPCRVSGLNPACYLTYLNPRVDRIACACNAVRDDLPRWIRDRRKPVTLADGLDIGWYQGVAPASRREMGIPADAFLVGCVTDNLPHKGVPVLLDAARLLTTAVPVHFLLAGHGMEADLLLPLLDGHPVAARCHFPRGHGDTLALMAGCDATALPSLRCEGLPREVMESMALGVVPVVTQAGGCPELVIDGESGLVVPPGDASALAAAITRLAENRVRARALGGAARARVATRFRLEQCIEQHAHLYAQLTGS